MTNRERGAQTAIGVAGIEEQVAFSQQMGDVIEAGQERDIRLSRRFKSAKCGDVLRVRQEIALGLVASQVAIKQLGTNGGGFYNVNSAHPLENPTPISNFIEMLSLLLIGGALCFTLGELVRDRRQGHALFAAMGLIFVPLLLVCLIAEQGGNPVLESLGVDPVASELQPGGNMEGKEVRFGIANSALWATATTAASNGSVNAMHDSFTPLGGLIPLFNIQLGEIIIGGVGAGLYGMLLFAVIAIFIAGLMVGRTPEYVGKKIEAKEIKMAMLAILILPLMYLGWTAVATVMPSAVASIANPGPHGFSEILYLFSSSTGNNGSAFGGITGNTPFYNTTGAVAMFVGRFLMIIPIMALAGSLAQKKISPPSVGTFPVSGGTFVILLLGTVVLVGALNFLPALALGPIVEHFLMLKGTLF